MKTSCYNQNQVDDVVKLLEDGGIVALPTDRVYGLGVIANNQDSINRLKKVKNRPEDKAFAYMVDSINKIEKVCELRDRDRFMISKFLPGPLTFIFEKKLNVEIVNESSLNSLAVRIPDHPFILECVANMEVGLYVPSANISSQPASINSDEVIQVFDGLIEGIVLGEAFNGQASTIIDCTQEELSCVREGVIDFQVIVDAVKQYERDI